MVFIKILLDFFDNIKISEKPHAKIAQIDRNRGAEGDDDQGSSQICQYKRHNKAGRGGDDAARRIKHTRKHHGCQHCVGQIIQHTADKFGLDLFPKGHKGDGADKVGHACHDENVKQRRKRLFIHAPSPPHP